MGGIGKSSLALRYATLAKNEYDVIFWIHSETYESVIMDYRELLKKLNIQANKPLENLENHEILDTFKYLNDPRKFLLIYDNIPNYTELRKVSPQFKCHIIVTSRSDNNWRPNAKIDLELFTPAVAVQYLLMDDKTVQNKEEALEIADSLGFLPLALSLAKKDIYKVSFKEYLKKTDYYTEKLLLDHPNERIRSLSKNFKNLSSDEKKVALKTMREEARSSSEYPFAIGITWNINRDQMHKESKDLLSLFSYLEPERIPLKSFIFKEDTRDLFDEGIVQLENYSLIKEQNGFISLHRLIQFVERRAQKGNEESILNSIMDKWVEFSNTEKRAYNNYSQEQRWESLRTNQLMQLHFEKLKEHMKKPFSDIDERTKVLKEALESCKNALTMGVMIGGSHEDHDIKSFGCTANPNSTLPPFIGSLGPGAKVMMHNVHFG